MESHNRRLPPKKSEEAEGKSIIKTAFLPIKIHLCVLFRTQYNAALVTLGEGSLFSLTLFLHNFFRRESTSMKLFLQAHLDANCMRFSVRTTEDGEKFNASTSCKDILLSTYKTNTIIIYVFFLFVHQNVIARLRTGCIKHKTLEKPSQKLFVQYTVMITETLCG